MNRESLFFKPTKKFCKTRKEYKEELHNFYHGDIDEKFMTYCAMQGLHAFWVNYKAQGCKVSKEKFSDKFRELINTMLKEL